MSLFGESYEPTQQTMSLEEALDDRANPGEPRDQSAPNPAEGGGQNAPQQPYPPQQNQQPVQTQNEPEPEPQPQGNEPIDDISVEDDYEKKIAFITQKFDSRDDLESSIMELHNKLGMEGQDLRFDNEEQAINYYIELEKRQGTEGQRRGEPSQQPYEQQNLETKVDQLEGTIKNLMWQLQNQQQGQYQQGQQPQQQAQQPAERQEPEPEEINFDDIDINQFMNEFYQDGPNAKSFKQAVKKISEQVADQKTQKIMEKEEKQKQELQQRREMAQKLKRNYDQQVDQIKHKYGEDQFQQAQDKMQDIFQKYPMYLQPNLFPNGFEKVFQMATKQSGMNQRQQQMAQQQQNQQNMQKMAARMPQSNSAQRFADNQPSQEEIELNQIFSGTNKGGVFG